MSYNYKANECYHSLAPYSYQDDRVGMTHKEAHKEFIAAKGYGYDDTFESFIYDSKIKII
jgi:hypothetical protein